MLYTLAEREGSLYAREAIVDEWEPRTIHNWYLLTTKMTEFATWFASEALMRQKVGCLLSPLSRPATIWVDEQGWTYRLTTGVASERKPTFTDFTPIAEPIQRGRKYPLRWWNGAWCRETKNGMIKVVQ